MTKIRNVLFDLDGTLTDPAEGIVRCIQHSLLTLEIACPPREELTRFIGPPLRELFVSVCNSTDELLIERAVTIFRERFSTIGLFENTPYEEVPEMLASLGNDYKLFVATSKPKLFAEQILQHFSFAHHFEEIQGNDLAGRLDDKAELLRELIERRDLRPEQTVMVGDRMHDVIAAKKNGVASIAVTYGYGSEAELTGAGADYFCDSPAAVAAMIATLTAGSN